MTRSRTAEWITICCWTLAYNFLVPIRYTQWFFYSIAAKRRVMTKSSSINREKFGRKFWDRKKRFQTWLSQTKKNNFQFFLLQRNPISPPGNVSWKNVTKRFLIVSSEFYNFGRGIEAVYLFYDTFRVKKWNIFWYHFSVITAEWITAKRHARDETASAKNLYLHIFFMLFQTVL